MKFNYKRAWREWARPELLKLPRPLRQLFGLVWFMSKDERLNADNQNDCRSWHKMPRVKSILEQYDNETLNRAQCIVHSFGHWAPMGNYSQDGGAYWKFERMVKDYLIRERGFCSVDAKWFEPDTDRFMEPETDREKLVAKWRARFAQANAPCSMFDIKEVNHRLKAGVDDRVKPHPFVIGSRHFNGNSVYLDPRSAPCDFCKYNFDDHTNDVVMIVGVKDGCDTEPIRAFLAGIADEIAVDKIDGFCFMKESDKVEA